MCHLTSNTCLSLGGLSEGGGLRDPSDCCTASGGETVFRSESLLDLLDEPTTA